MAFDAFAHIIFGLMIQCYRIAFSVGLDEKNFQIVYFLRTFEILRCIYKEKPTFKTRMLKVNQYPLSDIDVIKS